MIDVGRGLRDRRGADVLVLACAGMARYRADLEEAVQIPVVEPTQPRSRWRSGACGWARGGARKSLRARRRSLAPSPRLQVAFLFKAAYPIIEPPQPVGQPTDLGMGRADFGQQSGM